MTSSVPTRTLRLIELGRAQAVRAPVQVLLLFALQAVDVLARAALFAALGAGAGAALLRPVAFTAAMLFLLSWVLRTFVLGGAVVTLSRRLEGAAARDARSDQGSNLSTLVHALGAAPTVARYLLPAGALGVLVRVYRWLLLGCGALLVVHAALHRGGAFVPSAALSLAIVITLPLGVLGELWLELALIRAVRREELVLVGFASAFALLRARAWPAIAIALLTGGIAFVSELGLSLCFALFQLSPSPDVGAAARVCAALLTAFVLALLTLWRLGTLTALELDLAGQLPAEEVPAPLPRPTLPPGMLPSPDGAL